MVDSYLNRKGEEEQAMLLSPEMVTVISVWCGALIVEEIDPFDNSKRYPALNVQCKDKVKRASLGDWIVKREDKTFDVMKPNEFLYSVVNSDDPTL